MENDKREGKGGSTSSKSDTTQSPEMCAGLIQPCLYKTHQLSWVQIGIWEPKRVKNGEEERVKMFRRDVFAQL